MTNYFCTNFRINLIHFIKIICYHYQIFLDRTSNFAYCFRTFFRYRPFLHRKFQHRIENQVDLKLTCSGRGPTANTRLRGTSLQLIFQITETFIVMFWSKCKFIWKSMFLCGWKKKKGYLHPSNYSFVVKDLASITNSHFWCDIHRKILKSKWFPNQASTILPK